MYLFDSVLCNRIAVLIQRVTDLNVDAELEQYGAHGNPVATCDDREPEGSPKSMFAFFPAFAADVSEANPTATYEGKCFEEITFEYKGISETQFEVTVHTSKPKSLLCSDVIFFANTEITHIATLFFRGTHKITFNMNSKEAQEDVGYGGIKAFAFCEGVIPTLESVWTTFKAFFGACGVGPCHPKWPFIGWKVPKYMEKANVDFIEQSM